MGPVAGGGSLGVRSGFVAGSFGVRRRFVFRGWWFVLLELLGSFQRFLFSVKCWGLHLAGCARTVRNSFCKNYAPRELMIKAHVVDLTGIFNSDSSFYLSISGSPGMRELVVLCVYEFD